MQICYLFYGSDEAGVRHSAASVAAGFGSQADRIELTGTEIKADPALLLSQCSSPSLFNDLHYVRVIGVTDDSLPAVEQVMAFSGVIAPVVLLAGMLRRDSRLLQRLQSDPRAMVRASFPSKTLDVANDVRAYALKLGLRLDDEALHDVANSYGNDREIISRELEKIADYLDATVECPQVVSEATLGCIGATIEGDNLDSVLAALLDRNAKQLEALLRKTGVDDGAVPTIKASMRRFLVVAAVRAEVDRGLDVRSAVDRVARTSFKRERESVARSISHWSAADIRYVLGRLLDQELTLKSPNTLDRLGVDWLLQALTRRASSR